MDKAAEPSLGCHGQGDTVLLMHNIVANKERVFRYNMIASPNCSICRVVQDNVHLFCECVTVREAVLVETEVAWFSASRRGNYI